MYTILQCIAKPGCFLLLFDLGESLWIMVVPDEHILVYILNCFPSLLYTLNSIIHSIAQIYNYMQCRKHSTSTENAKSTCQCFIKNSLKQNKKNVLAQLCICRDYGASETSWVSGTVHACLAKLQKRIGEKYKVLSAFR